MNDPTIRIRVTADVSMDEGLLRTLRRFVPWLDEEEDEGEREEQPHEPPVQRPPRKTEQWHIEEQLREEREQQERRERTAEEALVEEQLREEPGEDDTCPQEQPPPTEPESCPVERGREAAEAFIEKTLRESRARQEEREQAEDGDAPKEEEQEDAPPTEEEEVTPVPHDDEPGSQEVALAPGWLWVREGKGDNTPKIVAITNRREEILTEAYPPGTGVNFFAELIKAAEWTAEQKHDAPQKLPTERGLTRFLLGWFGRTADEKELRREDAKGPDPMDDTTGATAEEAEAMLGEERDEEIKQALEDAGGVGALLEELGEKADAEMADTTEEEEDGD